MAEQVLTAVDDEVLEVKEELGRREASKLMIRNRLAKKNEERAKLRKLREILRKDVMERSSDDVEYLCRYPKVVNDLLRRKERKRQMEERSKEVYDTFDACINTFYRFCDCSKATS